MAEVTQEPKKRGPRLNFVERAIHLRQVSELYLKGHSQVEIGEALKCSQQQVSYDLKALQAEWAKRANWNIELAKARELAKVDELERTYWAAWARSMEQAQRMESGQKAKGGEEETHSRVTVEERIGDARYLAGVQWCIERRCKILGIDAPQKVAPTDPSGRKPYTPNVIRVREYLSPEAEAEGEADDSGY